VFIVAALAPPAEARVAIFATVELVISLLPEEVVTTSAAADPVAALSSPHDVVSFASVDPIVTLDDHVPPAVGNDQT
jgi:hypothetical protein